MQADHRMLRRSAKRVVEPGKLIRSEASANVPGIVTIEHDELPPIRCMGATNLKRCAGEFSAHRFGFVVIAGNAQHGFLETAENAAKAQVPRAVVLHQIAGDQHSRVVRNACKCIVEHRVQTRIGFYSTQLPLALP